MDCFKIILLQTKSVWTDHSALLLTNTFLKTLNRFEVLYFLLDLGQKLQSRGILLDSGSGCYSLRVLVWLLLLQIIWRVQVALLLICWHTKNISNVLQYCLLVGNVRATRFKLCIRFDLITTSLFIPETFIIASNITLSHLSFPLAIE